MTYRSILIPLDGDAECVARTATTLAIAQAMGSHVTGVAPTELLDLSATWRAAASGATLPGLGRDAMVAAATRHAVAFEVACEMAGVTARQSVVEESTLSVAMRRRGRVNDLIVLTQSQPQTEGHAFRSAQIEATLLASARPVLVLPYANAVATLGTRVLIAWDDSHAATRAIADALPLLRLARDVRIVTFNKVTTGDDVGRSDDLASLCEWLERHGVAAQASAMRTGIDVADALLSQASDLGTDLIVMGAYGHSHWTERILGGTTRSLLASMTVPVLMSH